MRIPSSIRYFNKRYTNRLMIKIAGKTHSPIALIRHIGRKTGIRYDTPIIAQKEAGYFVFALTYGKEVDWYRNIMGSKTGELLWRGKWYSLENPQPLNATHASGMFAQPMRAILRIINLQDYIVMTINDETM